MFSLNEVLLLSDGNPGAMDFLMGVEQANSILGMYIRGKVVSCGIRGADLYVLWSDLCDKDMGKVSVLCDRCPDDVLIDACSRQDCSGREIVRNYFV